MKYLTAIILTLAAVSVQAEAVIKEVCNDKTDKAGKVIMGKDGKPVQVCKKIKIHKKFEGTEIPPKK
jgi:hypothetical protein